MQLGRRRVAIVGLLSAAAMGTSGLAWAGEDSWLPPDELSEQQADAIPAGSATYGAGDQATDPVGVQGFDPAGSPDPAPSDVLGSDPAADQTQPTDVGPDAVAAQASVPACTLYANDPDLIAFRGRRTVEGSGWQICALGIGQRTQACLYKLHHFLFFNRWKKTRCGRDVYDRRPTFRPVAARKFCDPSGTGKWRTVIFGSIYYDGPNGPGRYHGAVRSENDISFSRCN